MFLSQAADHVSLLVRGFDLRKMSSYLAERLLANTKVAIRYRTELMGVEGTDHIAAVHVRESNGEVKREPTAGLFVFIRAKPRTDFLHASAATDEKGFLLTGTDVAALSVWKERRPPCTVETSLPRVFAAGDCRNATPKRVSFAIGDGVAAVTSVHNVLDAVAF